MIRNHYIMVIALLANTAKSSYDDNSTQRVKKDTFLTEPIH